MKARHYRGSQMIALAKAIRLQPPQTTWLGANSRKKKKCPTCDFLGPSFSHLTEGGISEKTACPNLLTIFSISVSAGQSRHAYRVFRGI